MSRRVCVTFLHLSSVCPVLLLVCLHLDKINYLILPIGLKLEVVHVTGLPVVPGLRFFEGQQL